MLADCKLPTKSTILSKTIISVSSQREGEILKRTIKAHNKIFLENKDKLFPPKILTAIMILLFLE